ncbi:MAG: SUMF1/EgtB/PvdO family nonheme iron enzyme [Treponema sp.]|nr:SUMF1/EgtB/PvdO family nonheme iron enzyme [Treponema sp.]
MRSKHGKDKSPAEAEPETFKEVRLKPLFGVRPGVYLAWVYGLAVLCILFGLLFLSGIISPGVLLSVKSEPYGAAVLVDGAHWGAAPCELFIPRGNREIELRLPGFAPRRVERDFGGRLFGSLFFPLKAGLDIKLEAPDPAAAFRDEAAEFAAWTFAGEPTQDYQIPLSLSEGAYRQGPGASDPAGRAAMEETLRASLGFAVTRAALRDLLRAKFFLDNQGLSPSPLTLLRSAGDILGILGDTPGAARWLGDVLNGEAAAAVKASAWYQKDAAEAGSSPPAPPPGRTLALEGLGFREIPGEGGLGGFFICETAVTREAWEAFLEERPQWKSENTGALAEEGLVNSDYLKQPEFPGSPGEGVPGVSWYAAGAWCDWFSSRLPPAYGSWEVRLPTEGEWEYAAKVRGAGMGDYWEWCGNPFVPLDFFPPPNEGSGPLSPERPVRGGAWINPSASVSRETRGSLPPDSCSPFVSFRPILAPKRTGP